MRKGWARRTLWTAGFPVRLALIGLIRLYRFTLGQMVGGGCRFHPTCSAYAEEAIRNTGAIRGSALAAWRVLRCSPLTPGGVDHPPQPPAWRVPYVVGIQGGEAAAHDAVIHHGGGPAGRAA